MRRYIFRLAMLTLAIIGPGTVRGDDQQIAEQIVQKLQAEKKAGALKGFSIDLQVEQGTVWLSGRVANGDQHAKALDIARRIRGVVQVVDDLTVSPAAIAAPAPLKSIETNGGRAIVNTSPRFDESPQPAAPPTIIARELPVNVVQAPSAIGSGVDPQPTPAALPGFVRYVCLENDEKKHLRLQ